MRYLSLFLCFKYLCRKKIVLLSIASVAMCCGLLIVVSSLFSGFIDAVESSAGETMGDVVINAPRGVKIPQYDVLIDKLQQSEVVRAATAVLTTNGGLLFLGKGNVRAVYIWGIEVDKRQEVLPFGDYLVSGNTEAGANGGYVGIGVVTSPDDVTDEYDFDVAKSFVGKKVKLTTGTSETEKPKVVKFIISDIVNSGVYQFDSSFVYLPIEDLTSQLYPTEKNIADMIQVKLVDGVDENQAAEEVRNIWLEFGEGRFGWAHYAKVQTSKEAKARIVSEYRKQMGILMLIFGIVSGGVILLIFCIFYLIVMTRFKDIAVMKSCGLGACGVAVLFIIFGLFVGVVGAGLGIVTGFVVTTNINAVEALISSALGLKLWKSSTYFFSEIPNVVHWEYVYWIAGASIIAAVIGALVPAIAAAKIRPVRILRYE